MANRRESDEAALADRLVSYSDALVAVTFLGVSGLGIAVADPDVRCTIADGATYIIRGNVGTGALFTAAIVVFRRWELALRADDPPSEQVAAYARWLHVGRLVILWISVVLAAVVANEAKDANCAADGWERDATETTTSAREVPIDRCRTGELAVDFEDRSSSSSLGA